LITPFLQKKTRMELVSPSLGLLFWMLVSFSIVLFILGKFAWPLILKGLKDREDFIDSALKSAEKAKAEMENLKSDNEKILNEARAERYKIIQEGKDIKDKVVSEAKTIAEAEARKIIEAAKETIKKEQAAAVDETKNLIANLSVSIAEKLLKKNLSSDASQQEYLNQVINEIKLN